MSKPILSNEGKTTTEATWRLVAIVLLINFIPSVIIPSILSYLKWISGSEAILLSTLLMILLVTSEVLFDTRAFGSSEKREIALWNIQNQFETRLSNIREAYRKVLIGNRKTPDLFESFFGEQLSALEHLITEAANRDQLHVTRGHLVNTSILLEGFNGLPSDLVRTIHFFEDNEWFFGIFNKQHFYQVYELVQQGKVKAVKKLFLFRNSAELEDEKTKRLIRFHSLTPNYDYKLMTVEAFHYILRDFRLEVPRDFGIYGDFIIYIGQDYRPDNVVGYYMRSSATLQAYISFFEACWSSPISVKAKNIDLSEPISIAELFDEV